MPVKKSVKRKTCLKCRKSAYRRGLCSSHYWLHRLAVSGLDITRRRVLESKLIRSGKLAEDSRGVGGGRKRKPRTEQRKLELMERIKKAREVRAAKVAKVQS